MALFRAKQKTTHCLAAVETLENWCECKRREVYSCTSWSAKVLLPDATLAKIAANGRLQTVADMESALNPPWIFAKEHGDEVLALLAQLDI